VSSAEHAARLSHHFQEAFGQALSSLSGSDFTVSVIDGGDALPMADQPYLWEQSLSLAQGSALWLSASRDVWPVMAKMTLEAAGVNDPSEEDLRSTWQEIVSQTMAGVANGLTADMLREVTLSGGQEASAEPAESRWAGLRIATGSAGEWTARVGWSVALEEALERRPGDMRTRAGKENKVSRTFDLLLDVALPVGVSFGRTALQIREVLKLNTGSIIELNRLVSDPVDVVVNDCVIARGEVVVVDGNYGVRIKQLASREDRLRSGMAEAVALAGSGR
jgi:flagellar motor switch protein FliN/FliY